MSTHAEGITNPPIDELLDSIDSKYRLVIFAAKRARQINAYLGSKGDALVVGVGPLVDRGPQEKPLSIALRELNEGLLEYSEVDPHAMQEDAEVDLTPNFEFDSGYDADTDPF